MISESGEIEFFQLKTTIKPLNLTYYKIDSESEFQTSQKYKMRIFKLVNCCFIILQQDFQIKQERVKYRNQAFTDKRG